MKKILLTTFALVVLSGCAHKQQTADEQQAQTSGYLQEFQ